MLLLQGFQVTIHKTVTPPLLFLWTSEVLWSRTPLLHSTARLFNNSAWESRSCSVLEAKSLSPTQPLSCYVCPSEEAEGRRVRNSWHTATAPRSFPKRLFPPGYYPDWLFLSALIALSVLRIPIVLGISFIVSRIWVAAPFFFPPYTPLEF